mgnify:CR=1 FL=1
MKKISLGLGLTLAALLLAIAVLPQQAARAVTDTTPPTGTIVINDNKSCTNSRNVTIAMTWADNAGGSGVARMRFSNDGSTWSAYESLTPSRSYQLPAGDGYKTVRVQFIDLANNRSATYSDYIRLDTVAPTGSIIINKGDLTTTKQSVTLGLTYADGTGSGVVRMRFSDNGSTWTNWMYPTATKAYKLPKSELGYQTVRVQYLDGANNYSPVYNDYIKLVAPTAGAEETIMLPGNVPLVMKWIPAGSFAMGSPDTDMNAMNWEKPQHTVTLAGFWMGKCELTVAQMRALTGTEPCVACGNILGDENAPAVYINWNDAHAVLTALNTHTGKTFRLPSEAQFQYALRAGTTTQYYWGDDGSDATASQYAWYMTNTINAGEAYAHLVGQKKPNAWGLYDMVGNALEWYEDDWHDSYTGAPVDGSAWVDAPRAAYRAFHDYGVSDYAGSLRSANRTAYPPTASDWSIGMRVVRIP